MSFAWLIIGIQAETFAAPLPVFEPQDGSPDTYLGHYVAILADDQEEYTLDDVIRQMGEMELSETSMPSLGFRASACWFHLRIDTTKLEAQDYRFLIDYAFLDLVTMYQVVDDVVINSMSVGDSLRFSERPYPYETFILPLNLPKAKTVDFYFKVQSTESLIFPLRFVSESQQEVVIMEWTYLYGALFGAMGLIILYNVCLSLILRDATYVLYWLYLLVQSSYQFIYSGHAFRFWWPDSPELQEPSIVFGGLFVVVLAIQFSRSFLKTGVSYPAWDRYLSLLSWSSLALITLGYGYDEQMGIIAVSALSFGVPFSFSVVAFWVYRDLRSVPALYFLIAFGVLIFGYSYTGLAALGFLPFSGWSMSILPAAVVLEGTLLSLGLAHRIRSLQIEKAATLELLLEQSTHAARLGESAQRFVPHEFLEFLGREDISEVQLGDSVSSEMTVLFSDIRSFTSLSEGMNPQENFEFVNDYLQVVTPVIYRHGGFVDKYIGDAVMALFHGDPRQACACALEIEADLKRYNQARVADGEKPIYSGIGIHTGSVMLGTVGDTQRLQTTVISDAVNLASRIEGLTKQYGHTILLSEAVVEGMSDQDGFLLTMVGDAEVKGKSVSTTLYALKMA
ncbi:MAG: 7TM diverse intracellular signaling domain-containing protein [Myxococcota bacterium]|nr:7TM diverse intracellular signaling domain-containing protein [Myxococcota bacterium]